MLDFQLQQIPFRFGLSEGTDPHQVPPGTLTTAENVAWKQSGRVEKRFGVAAPLVRTLVDGGTAIASATRLFTRGSELCLIDGASLYAYAPTLAKWRNVGRVPNVGMTWATVSNQVSGCQRPDSAISAAGQRIDAWTTGDGAVGANGALFVQVTDVTSGALQLAPTQLASSLIGNVRVVVIGTTAIVVANTSAVVKAWTVDLSTLVVSAPTTLRSDVAFIATGVGAYASFDAIAVGTNFIVAYTATGPLLKLYSYNASLVQQATGGITGEANGAAMVSIDGVSGEGLYVFYQSGEVAGVSMLRLALANVSTLAQTVAPSTIETLAAATEARSVGVCRYDASNCIVAYTAPGVGGTEMWRATTYKVSNAALITASSERGTFGNYMLSAPFMFGGSCYMLLSDGVVGGGRSDINSCLVEVEVTARVSPFTPHRLVGLIDPLVGGLVPYGTTLAKASSVSATSVTIPLPFQEVTNPSYVRQGLRILSLTLGASLPADMWRITGAGQEAFIYAGILSAYDGRAAFDYGFLRSPTIYSATASNGTGNMVAGTYLYGVVLEYRSATGLLYRSPPDTSGTVTFAAPSDTVVVTSQCYNLGNKQTIATLFGSSSALPTLHAWYRTVVNGTVYQRRTLEPTDTVTYVDQLTENVSFTDLAADAAVGGSANGMASRPAMYTTGGILDDYTPPGGVTTFQHRQRLWALTGDQKTWWYSKSFQDDLGVAPGFHPDFRISFAETQSCGIGMDDKHIFFSATGVAYMQGDGPAPNGANSDYIAPSQIQSDVGCTSPRSLVSTPDGIMFLSARGICLLTRGLEIVWLGRPIKDTLAAYPTVTSAVLVAKHSEVRFTCTTTAGTTGIVLVYNYVEKQWSTSKYHDGTTYGCAIADACIHNGAWTFVTPAGLVFSESTTSYLDNATYVPMTLETAWIAAAGPLAFQSVRTFALHGQSFTNHDLTVSVGFDSDTSYPQVASFAAQSTVTTVGVEECEVIIGTRRKCQTIRFKVVDATPTTGAVSTGRGPAFDMMGLEVGVKRGFAGLPATKRA